METGNEVKNSDDSILIPKIDTEDLAVSKTPQEATINPPIKRIVPGDNPKKKFNKKPFIIGLSVFAFLLVIFVVPWVVFGFQARSSYKTISPIVSSFNANDPEKVKADLGVVSAEISRLKKTYKFVTPSKIIPYYGKYVTDLGNALSAGDLILQSANITIETVKPYMAALGFDQDAAGDGEKTAQERIDFIVSAIPEIVPKADEISGKLSEAEKYLSKIDPQRYPENFRGFALREKLKRGLDLFSLVSSYAVKSKPILESAPYLLGMDSPRNYLVLFQNDKELRATGGFLTAYSVMKVEDAKFEPVLSADIYNLDAKYKPTLPAPEAIVDLIKGPYIISQNIRLRDINYDPSFEDSMKLFVSEAKKAGIEDFDGVIAVDTALLVNILDVMGEIGVPGFGNFSTKIEPKCNCPQVIYELESFADNEGPIVWDPVSGKIVYAPPNYDNRKKIIGPLMNSVLANALAQPKEKLPQLADAIFKSLMEKHVLFYIFDETVQKAVSDFGIAGTLDSVDFDYLHINDSNLGGRKSNLYVTQEVAQEISISKDGTIQKVLTITYKNPEKYDGWLNSVLPNWVRVYVPKGSTLDSVEGLTKKYEPFEEHGKTVFSGYFELRPEGVSKVIITYTLPFKYDGDYKMLIQKQPGTDKPLYVIVTPKTESEFLLNADKRIRVSI